MSVLLSLLSEGMSRLQTRKNLQWLARSLLRASCSCRRTTRSTCRSGRSRALLPQLPSSPQVQAGKAPARHGPQVSAGVGRTSRSLPMSAAKVAEFGQRYLDACNRDDPPSEGSAASLLGSALSRLLGELLK